MSEHLTVGDLIELLQKYPSDCPVVIGDVEDNGYNPIKLLTLIKVSEHIGYFSAWAKVNEQSKNKIDVVVLR